MKQAPTARRPGDRESHIEGEPPVSILDLGCGPGRDLKAFAQLGHRAIGLEGCSRFVELVHYYRPAGLPREQQPWLASAWRRVD